MKRDPRRRIAVRHGATAVEVAMVLPVMLAIFFTLVEFGHAYMMTQLIKTAARQAARYGISDGKSTTQVIAEARKVLSATMNPSSATVYVKDASLFDNSSVSMPTNYSSLSDVQVQNLESRQLFLVRIEVPYNSVSLFPAGFWHTYMHNLTLSGQAVMRHE